MRREYIGEILRERFATDIEQSQRRKFAGWIYASERTQQCGWWAEDIDLLVAKEWQEIRTESDCFIIERDERRARSEGEIGFFD